MACEVGISIVVVAFNMGRELPRTLRTLSPAMQQGVAPRQIEILVVDNGSDQPLTEADCPIDGVRVRWLHVDNPTPSPVAAVHLGLSLASHPLVGVMIDGARMASPGLLAGALAAQRVHPRAVIASLGFHLGPEVQMVSVAQGYDQAAEDALLASVPWQEDGYHLFDISVPANSSADGWFSPIAESNALFMDKSLWAELGGYDARFKSPGGGLVNLDTYRRACELPDMQLVVLLGEGTFHQIHGGVAASAKEHPWGAFHSEYVSIRGELFRQPRIEPVFFGRVRPQVLPSIERAVRAEKAGKWRESVSPDRPPTRTGPQELCALSGLALSSIQRGVLSTRYRGRALLKNPFDLVIYLQLLQRLQPRTVLEIGAKEGGSALWFADTLSNLGIDGRVIAVDIAPVPPLDDARIEVIRGDALALCDVLAAERLDALPRPLLVVEDSAHSYEVCRAVLDTLDPHLRSGDYLVVEDGVVAFLPEAFYRRYKNGPTRAIADFLGERPGRYEIDRSLCDFFGPNVTFNPNGYLRRL